MLSYPLVPQEYLCLSLMPLFLARPSSPTLKFPLAVGCKALSSPAVMLTGTQNGGRGAAPAVLGYRLSAIGMDREP